ncbi:hypothetical protein B566_EDAN008092 [Ephemera danica]|nr:hypothetical protein B566_EDAN008092 [Ephemera danica]
MAAGKSMLSMTQQGVAVGIDLGTSFSAIAVYKTSTKQTKVLVDGQGQVATPSVVGFTHTAQLVGNKALEQIASNPENTIAEVKRLMGRRFAEPQVQEDARRWPFTLVEKGGEPRLQVQFRGETRQYRPEQVSAIILLHLKKIACEHLNLPPFSPMDAVLTVPVNFGDSQRLATREACQIAGINGTRSGRDERVLVFDMGGGTTDVSLVHLGSANEYEVLACVGNNKLGGEDLDTRLVNHCLSQVEAPWKESVESSRAATVRLRLECERAKRKLSSTRNVTVSVDEIVPGYNFTCKISRIRFEMLVLELLKKAVDMLTTCLRDANLSTTNIAKVVLAGGSTRIPRLKELIGEALPGVPLHDSLSQDEAVATGAALQAARDKQLLEVNLSLMEKIPWTLGVEDYWGKNIIIVEKNATIPVKKTKRVQTAVDYQTGIRYNVYEGEDRVSKKNNLLGTFNLNGIRVALKGETETDLTYEVDQHGILHCTAVEIDAAKNNTISISIERYKKLLTAHELTGFTQQAETEHMQGLVHDLCQQVEHLSKKVKNEKQRDKLKEEAAKAVQWARSNPTPLASEFGQLVDEMNQGLESYGITVSSFGKVTKQPK